MRSQRATEHWKAPPIQTVHTPTISRPPLTIITPATTTKKKNLKDPSTFTYDVSCKSCIKFNTFNCLITELISLI